MLRRLQVVLLSTLLGLGTVFAFYEGIGPSSKSLDVVSTGPSLTNDNGAEKRYDLRLPASSTNSNDAPDIGEDPNLAYSSDRTKTEGDICYSCGGFSYSTEVKKKNYKSLKDITLDIESAELRHLLPLDPANPVWSQFPEVLEYSENPKTKNTILTALKNKLARSKRSCYRYVKFALADATNNPKPVADAGWLEAKTGPEALVEKPLIEPLAKDAEVELKAQGFINMMEDPRYKDMIERPADAPKGAVLIYEHTTDKKHAGHIEIKEDWNEKGGYISDFVRKDHDGMVNRKLIGVMIQPGEAQ